MTAILATSAKRTVRRFSKRVRDVIAPSSSSIGKAVPSSYSYKRTRNWQFTTVIVHCQQNTEKLALRWAQRLRNIM
jgi:hypothetical protein